MSGCEDGRGVLDDALEDRRALLLLFGPALLLGLVFLMAAVLFFLPRRLPAFLVGLVLGLALFKVGFAGCGLGLTGTGRVSGLSWSRSMGWGAGGGAGRLEGQAGRFWDDAEGLLSGM